VGNSRVGPECQGSTGAAHGEKEIGQHSDEDGPPLANRTCPPSYPKPPGAFLDKLGFFSGRLCAALNRFLNKCAAPPANE
jgi:hypothetical protein